jgi:hypothetical protein
MITYKSYIQSDEWRRVRERYRASRLPQTCHVCNVARVDLHHKTYKRLGNERLTDLVPLCRDHHTEAHTLVRAAWARGANKSKVNLWSVARTMRRQRIKRSP